MDSVADPGSSYSDWLIDDAPITSLAHDQMWSDTPVLKYIETISRRVLKPLEQANDGYCKGVPSIAFAVFGGWGTGKSSFLRVVRTRAEALAGERNFPRQLRCIYYNASVYESTQIPPEYSLAMAILEGLGLDRARAEAAALRSLVSGVPDSSRRRPLDGVRRRGASAAKPQRQLDVAPPSSRTEWHERIVDFPEKIDDLLTGQGGMADGTTRSALILIDELDRCDPGFVFQILRLVKYWSEAHNQVYLLAGDRRVFLEAVDTSSVLKLGTPSHALQKYVQHEIELPPVRSDQLESVLDSLVKDQQAPELKEIQENALLLTMALTGEDVPDPEIREFANPRALKKMLNAIRWEVAAGLERLNRLPTDSNAPSPEDRQLVVKTAVMMHRWPEYYDRLVKRRQERSDKTSTSAIVTLYRNALSELEELSRQYFDPARMGEETSENREEFKERWEEVLKRIPGPELDFCNDLALYFSLPPYWSPRTTTPSMFFTPGASHPESEGSDQIRDLFMRFYVQSEAEEQQGNRELALSLVKELHELVRANRRVFGPREASYVGNAAVTAERFKDVNLANTMYALAIELDPAHSNSLQNYADFIVQFQLKDLYDTADDYLKKLESPPHDQRNSARTLALRARLTSLRQSAHADKSDSPPIDPAELDDAIAKLKENPENKETLVWIARALGTTNDLGTLRDLEADLREREVSPDLQYFYRRTVADTLATSSDPRDQCEAMDRYRELLDWDPQYEENPTQLQHNYALLLSKHDYDEEAGRMWRRAYVARPDDPVISRAYSRYLLQAENPDAAMRVVRGDSLDDLDEGSSPTLYFLKPGSHPVPDRSFCEDLLRP